MNINLVHNQEMEIFIMQDHLHIIRITKIIETIEITGHNHVTIITTIILIITTVDTIITAIVTVIKIILRINQIFGIVEITDNRIKHSIES